jgi:hypothetical protein
MAKFDRYAPFDGGAPAASEAKPLDRYAPFTPTATGSSSAPEEGSDVNPAAIAAGAAVGYGANKFFPLDPIDSQAKNRAANLKDELSGLRAQGRVASQQLESARAPFAAAQGVTEAAQMELARNRMLMEFVTQRAMQLGVDPQDFVKSPELFVKAMAPQAGYGSKNWFKSEYGNVNPIIENQLVGKGGAKDAVAQYAATEPKAQRVFGPSAQLPSGLLVEPGRSSEGTRAGMMVGNIDKTLQEAIIAREAAQAAEAAAQSSIDPKLASTVDRLERQVAGSKAEMLAAQKAVPTAAEKIASYVSGPKVGAGLGAISAYKLPQAYEEFMRGNYRDAMLHGLEGVSGALMLAPHPLVKAAGVAAMAPSLAYEYGPLAYDAIRKGFNYFTPKK